MSAPGLTGRSALNFLASLVVYLLRLGAGFVVNPVIVNGLGTTGFGLWQVSQRLLTYVATAEGRASQALKWRVANRQHSSNLEENQDDIGAAVLIWLGFLPLVLLVGAPLAWFSPSFVKDLDPAWWPALKTACAVLVVRLALTGLAMIPESVLQGANLGYRTVWIRAGSELAAAVLSYAAVTLGWGLTGLAAALTVSVVLGGALHLRMAHRLLPWYGIRRPDRDRVRSFLSFSVWIFGWTFVNKVILFGDVVVLGWVIGADAVAVYSLTLYAAQTGMHLMAMLVSGAVPGIGALIGEGRLDKAAAVRGELWLLAWFFMTVLGAVVLACNRSFVTLWVGELRYLGDPGNLLLVAMITQLVLIRLDAFIIDVTLQLREKVLLGLASAVLTAGFSALGGAMAGTEGLILGLMIGRLLLSWGFPRLVSRQLRIGAAPRFGGIIRPLAFSAAVGWGAHALGSGWRTDSWLLLAALASATVATAAAGAYLLGLDEARRAVIRTRFNALRSR